jgi:hypothetical protein
MKKSRLLLLNLGTCLLLILTAFIFSVPALAKAPVTNGAITGKVVDAVNGKNVKGVWIHINQTPAGFSGAVQTEVDGTYSLSVPAGTYQALASPQESVLPYMDQWYNGASDIGSASTINVKSGATTPNINFKLTPTGTIAGHVYNADGKAVRGAVVTLLNATLPNIAPMTFTTGKDGGYYFTGLNGSYKVLTVAAGYAQQFYQNTLRFINATPITADSHAGAANIDFHLVAGGTISGTVTDQGTGNLRTGISLKIQEADSPATSWIVKTDNNGQYSINIPDGNYIVNAPSGLNDINGNPIGPDDADYVTEYWQEKVSLEEATPVIIGAKHITARNINFTLSHVIIGAISGTVYDDGGNSIPGATVTAIFAENNLDAFVMKASSQALTDASGNYTLSITRAGPYTVAAVANGRERRWYRYPGESTTYIERIGNDHLINVGAGSNFTSIDFNLGPGGTISGRVTDDSPHPRVLSNVSVWAFANLDVSSNNTPIACITHTDTQGNYTLDGLAFNVSYAVISPFSISIGNSRLQSGDGDYVAEYWHEDSSFPHSPDFLSLSSENSSLIGINFTLQKGGTISGRVTNSDGAPVLYAAITTYAYNAERGYWDTYCTGGYTDADGYYKTSGLPAGIYTLSVTYYNASGKHEVWYNNQLTPELAEPIKVSVSKESSGIDFILP